MDVSTGTMAGMPEMDYAGHGPAMLGGLMGGRGGGAGSSNTTYGMARSMNIMPPRVLDIALHNTRKPGVEASQAIPAGMRMGDSLPLVPPQGAGARARAGRDAAGIQARTPKGRILIYWGCGEQVRAGQPRVIDLARGNPAEFGTALAGRYAPDRGARVSPAYALYPNEKNTRDPGARQLAGGRAPGARRRHPGLDEVHARPGAGPHAGDRAGKPRRTSPTASQPAGGL